MSNGRITVNKERMRLWVAALRNPDLVQGFGCLAQRKQEADPWQQCCLDVATRVAMDNGLALHETVRQSSPRGYMRAYSPPGEIEHSQALLPPEEVLDWYGITGDCSVELGDGETAASLNDDQTFTFSQIADVIEEHFDLNED